MKLGISMYSYYALWRKDEMDAAGFIQAARRAGADGVELLEPLWRNKEQELPIAQAALSDNNLTVGVYSVSNDFVSPNLQDRDAALDKIKVGVETARRLGAKVVRVFAGNAKEGISFDQAFHWIVEGLRKVRIAASGSVRLALENHGLLAGKSEQVKRILDAVGNPALGANPDTGNFLLVHEAPHEAIHALARSAAMVHFKDFREVPMDYEGSAYTSTDGLKFVGAAIGEGDVALASCVKELRAAKFDGWLNIEYEGAEDPVEALPRSVAYTRALLHTA